MSKLTFLISIFYLVPLIALTCTQMLIVAESTCQLIQLQAINLVSGIFSRCPRYRDVIFEDIFPILLRLPSIKKGRVFRVECPSELWSDLESRKDSSSKHIQYITLFIMQLVQSCVLKSRLPMLKEKSDESSQDDSSKYTSGLTQATQYCNMFASKLLSRCNIKNEDGRASEFRPILNGIVDDLLCVLRMRLSAFLCRQAFHRFRSGEPPL